MRIDRENPCQPGSAARKIVGVLLNTRKRSLAPTEIAYRSKIAIQTVKQVVAALLNPYHNAAIAKAGLAVERTVDGRFCIKACRPKPDAHRPPAKRTAQETAPAAMEAAA